MPKRNQPYAEIINLQNELKEYRKLCVGKSDKFKYYLDWKKHIIEKFSKLDSPDKIINFKHYLISENRINKNANAYLVAILICCITLYFNKLDIKYDWFSLIISIILIIFEIMWQSEHQNKEYCFYCDLIEIIEEIESED